MWWISIISSLISITNAVLVLYLGAKPRELAKVYEESESDADRKKVKEALKLFDEIVKISKANSRHQTMACYTLAARTLREQNGWVNVGKRVGDVPGVCVGDRFECRAQLRIIGLHDHYIRGIDYMKMIDGTLLATSIVVSGRYANRFSSRNILIYSGEGENPLVSRNRRPRDQRLVRGNLALKSSMEWASPVRVIKSIKLGRVGNKRDSIFRYVYYGLYAVDRTWQQRGQYGKLVFNYRLKRINDQLESKEEIGLPPKKYKKAKIGGRCSEMTQIRCPPLLKDLSDEKEKVPIPVVNTINGEYPPDFCYIKQMVYPERNDFTLPSGCNCTHGCSSSTTCLCMIKNGGEFPYSWSGRNLKKKPIIYECGIFCKCSSSCMNRVSQRGIQVQLEVFRKHCELDWAVRSLSFIRAGCFVCEYVGEIFPDNKAKTGRSSGKYMLGINSLRHMQPSGMTSFSYGVHEIFTIDSRLMGNVGRYVNHKQSPNLYVQYVLYDHDDKRMPHAMLFALKDIHPGQELTLNYYSS